MDFYIWTPKLSEKYVCNPFFQKKDHEVHNNTPKTALSMKFYLWACKYLEKMQPIIFLKRSWTSIQPTCGPILLQKKC
jgi:hypothetical protein